MPEDILVFNQYVDYINSYKHSNIKEILEQTALFFLNTPYVANTLDKNEEEQLVINLREVDCVTFVENVVALSLATKKGNLSFRSFKEQLTCLRYRNCLIEDYSSRLHYTSDWIYENERRGVLKNISQQLGGTKENGAINFMSRHSGSYKQLKHNDVMRNKIAQMEKRINRRENFFFIPKERINDLASIIPHMAIIGFVTSIEGLDTTHIGFAFYRNNRLTFIHASSIKNRVVIDQQTLSAYTLSQSKCKGIIVATII